MLKNKIKAIKIGFLIVCILPTMSYAFDKEDLLKFLVKSSYPEVKVIDKTEDNKNNENNKKDINSDDKSEAENTEKQDEEYVKVHVGEENIPVLNENKASTESDSKYINDLRITKESPEILIYHSHSSETYSDSPEDNYHSTDKNNSVMAIGDELTTQLSNKGWGVAHSQTYNDLSYNESYANSYKTINSIMSKYNSVDIAIDLHRDGLKISNKSTEKNLHDKYTTEINGETVAKFFLVVGNRNENVNELKKEAESITELAEKKYPGLVEPVVIKPYGKYNQYVADNHILVEVGSNATSTKEAKATCKYLAEILNDYYKNKK